MDSSKKRYVLSIDQGTTSTRLAIIDDQLHIVALEQVEHEQIHLNPGWTEHDPMQLYFNIELLLQRLQHNHKDVNILYYNIIK
jgi:glycerol kinase